MVVMIVSNNNLRGELFDFADGDASSLEIVVVFKRHISRVELIVGRTRVLLETGELFTCLHFDLHDSSEVPSGEDTVVRDHVVLGGRFKVVVVLEAGSI